jgi:hypothetical protein
MTERRDYHSVDEIAKLARDPEAWAWRLKGAVKHSPDEIRHFQELVRNRPLAARQTSAIVSYARKRGGLTLKCWELLKGPAFGKPWIMTPAACAEELNISVDQVKTIMEETQEAVHKGGEGGSATDDVERHGPT